MRRAVAALPDNQRKVIELLKFEELSVREVAARLGMSEANVKVTAHRGIARSAQDRGVPCGLKI